MNSARILASVIFGSIGLAAFVYGKKQANLKSLVIGVILMVYPYFVPDPVAVYVIGAALTIALFLPFWS